MFAVDMYSSTSLFRLANDLPLSVGYIGLPLSEGARRQALLNPVGLQIFSDAPPASHSITVWGWGALIGRSRAFEGHGMGRSLRSRFTSWFSGPGRSCGTLWSCGKSVAVRPCSTSPPCPGSWKSGGATMAIFSAVRVARVSGRSPASASPDSSHGLDEALVRGPRQLPFRWPSGRRRPLIVFTHRTKNKYLRLKMSFHGKPVGWALALDTQWIATNNLARCASARSSIVSPRPVTEVGNHFSKRPNIWKNGEWT